VTRTISKGLKFTHFAPCPSIINNNKIMPSAQPQKNIHGCRRCWKCI